MEWQHIVRNGIVNDKKWELKNNNIVLGTIFHQPTDKFAVYISVPVVYEKVYAMAGKTHTFDSFEEAKQGFIDLTKDQVLSWCRELITHLGSVTCY
ncbi:hypothetical protein LCGC14_0997270 [marine sediment metagenome]|uniref:Uncharacterized protein n=1 Tax=marine sediment metagenome TaxID=412755 RepID=A0A0F9N437_9ZZZZ